MRCRYSLHWSGTFGTLQFGIGRNRYPWVPFAVDFGHWCIWIKDDQMFHDRDVEVEEK